MPIIIFPERLAYDLVKPARSSFRYPPQPLPLTRKSDGWRSEGAKRSLSFVCGPLPIVSSAAQSAGEASQGQRLDLSVDQF